VQAAGSTNADVLQWAKTYETLSLGQSTDLAYVYSNTNPSTGLVAQMLIGPTPQRPDVSTPEPAAFVLVGAGLIAGSLALRKTSARR